MKKLALVALLLLACEKHDDSPPTTSTTATATATETVTATVSATPLATIAPAPTTSAAPSPPVASASSAAERQQLQMLQALGGKKAIEEALRSSDVPVNELSANPRTKTGEVEFGTGLRPPRGGPGAGGIGARDH